MAAGRKRLSARAGIAYHQIMKRNGLHILAVFALVLALAAAGSVNAVPVAGSGADHAVAMADGNQDCAACTSGGAAKSACSGLCLANAATIAGASQLRAVPVGRHAGATISAALDGLVQPPAIGPPRRLSRS